MRIFWSTAVVLLIDQVTKVVVFQTMYRGQSIPLLGDWLKLTFTENPGMAFGITFGPPGMVTVLSILATGLIIFYMYRVRGTYAPYRFSLAIVLGGALGNIIDRVFYGVLFDYGSLFKGKVVDFIHVDVWRGMVPDIVPVLGGSYMALFPIWNVADMAIVLGVVGILVFQHRFHEELEQAHRAGLEGAPNLPWDRQADEEPGAFVPPQVVPVNGHPDEETPQADGAGSEMEGDVTTHTTTTPPAVDEEGSAPESDAEPLPPSGAAGEATDRPGPSG